MAQGDLESVLACRPGWTSTPIAVELRPARSARSPGRCASPAARMGVSPSAPSAATTTPRRPRMSSGPHRAPPERRRHPVDDQVVVLHADLRTHAGQARRRSRTGRRTRSRSRSWCRPRSTAPPPAAAGSRSPDPGTAASPHPSLGRGRPAPSPTGRRPRARCACPCAQRSTSSSRWSARVPRSVISPAGDSRAPRGTWRPRVGRASRRARRRAARSTPSMSIVGAARHRRPAPPCG